MTNRETVPQTTDGIGSMVSPCPSYMGPPDAVEHAFEVPSGMQSQLTTATPVDAFDPTV